MNRTGSGDDGGAEGGAALPGVHREDSQDCIQDQRSSRGGDRQGEGNGDGEGDYGRQSSGGEFDAQA